MKNSNRTVTEARRLLDQLQATQGITAVVFDGKVETSFYNCTGRDIVIKEDSTPFDRKALFNNLKTKQHDN
jgi:1,4-dihydroxy-2-naphthoyl-CoA synthase